MLDLPKSPPEKPSSDASDSSSATASNFLQNFVSPLIPSGPDSQHFLSKLFELVDDRGTDEVISWKDDGSGFIIHQPYLFDKDFRPYFSHKGFQLRTFAAFLRCLTNGLGFTIARDRWEFTRHDFRRGQPMFYFSEPVTCLKDDQIGSSDDKPTSQTDRCYLWMMQGGAENLGGENTSEYGVPDQNTSPQPVLEKSWLSTEPDEIETMDDLENPPFPIQRFRKILLESFSLEILIAKRADRLNRGMRNDVGGDFKEQQLEQESPDDNLQKFSSSLKPTLRLVVSKGGKLALSKLLGGGRPSAKQIDGSDGRNLRLHFRTQLPLILFTGKRVKGEQGDAVQVVLLDANSGHIVSSDPASFIKLDVVALDGNFKYEDNKEWTAKEFDSCIVNQREGRGPLLIGNLQVTLNEGVGTLGDLAFTDNAHWFKSRRYRLGLKVASGFFNGIRIREAKSRPFMVKNIGIKLGRKHYPVALNDEVWRLEKISKNGIFHERLDDHGIFTVEDFLRLSVRDSAKLRNIVNTTSNETWDAIQKHAKTCDLGEKFYAYYPDNSRSVGLIFNAIDALCGLVSGEQYFPADCLSYEQKVFVDKLVKKAYDNWNQMAEYVGKSHFNLKQNKGSSGSDNDNQSIEESSMNTGTDETEMVSNKVVEKRKHQSEKRVQPLTVDCISLENVIEELADKFRMPMLPPAYPGVRDCSSSVSSIRAAVMSLPLVHPPIFSNDAQAPPQSHAKYWSLIRMLIPLIRWKRRSLGQGMSYQLGWTSTVESSPFLHAPMFPKDAQALARSHIKYWSLIKMLIPILRWKRRVSNQLKRRSIVESLPLLYPPIFPKDAQAPARSLKSWSLIMMLIRLIRWKRRSLARGMSYQLEWRSMAVSSRLLHPWNLVNHISESLVESCITTELDETEVSDKVNLPHTSSSKFEPSVFRPDESLDPGLIDHCKPVFHPLWPETPLQEVVEKSKHVNLEKLVEKEIADEFEMSILSPTRSVDLKYIDKVEDIVLSISKITKIGVDANFLTRMILPFHNLFYKAPRPLPRIFQADNFTELHLPYYSHRLLWAGKLALVNLKLLNLKHSLMLTSLPNLSMAQKIVHLNCRGCVKLNQVSFIRNLSKLEELNLTNCEHIRVLPSLIGLQNLKEFYLSGCSNLTNLPPSIIALNNLVVLDLKNCAQLIKLPLIACGLRSLLKLNISGCTNILRSLDTKKNGGSHQSNARFVSNTICKYECSSTTGRASESVGAAACERKKHATKKAKKNSAPEILQAECIKDRKLTIKKFKWTAAIKMEKERKRKSLESLAMTHKDVRVKRNCSDSCDSVSSTGQPAEEPESVEKFSYGHGSAPEAMQEAILDSGSKLIGDTEPAPMDPARTLNKNPFTHLAVEDSSWGKSKDVGHGIQMQPEAISLCNSGLHPLEEYTEKVPLDFSKTTSLCDPHNSAELCYGGMESSTKIFNHQPNEMELLPSYEDNDDIGGLKDEIQRLQEQLQASEKRRDDAHQRYYSLELELRPLRAELEVEHVNLAKQKVVESELEAMEDLKKLVAEFDFNYDTTF